MYAWKCWRESRARATPGASPSRLCKWKTDSRKPSRTNFQIVAPLPAYSAANRSACRVNVAPEPAVSGAIDFATGKPSPGITSQKWRSAPDAASSSSTLPRPSRKSTPFAQMDTEIVRTTS